MSDWETAPSPINDDLLDGLRQVESGGNPNAIGPMTRFGQAKGAYQFTDDTAKRFGIDPLDENQSREAARSYLTDMHSKFGDTDLALAGYNWGPNNVAKLLKAGYTKDEILAQAPQETQDYVNKVNKEANKNKGWEVAPTNDSGWETAKDDSKDGWETANQEEQQPWFKGDPTASITNYIKQKGTELGSDPEGALLGAAHGLYSGLMQGAHALTLATPTGASDFIASGKTPSQFLQEGENLGNTFRDVMTPQFQQKLEQSAGSQAAQQILSLPFMPISKATQFLKDSGHPELGASLMLAASGAATVAMLKGGAEGAAKELKATEGPIEASTHDAAIDAAIHGPNGKPAARDPNEPFYVNSDGVAARADQVEALNQAKAAYEARQASPQSTPPVRDPVQGELDINPETNNPILGEITEKPNAKAKDLFGQENLDRSDKAAQDLKEQQIDQAFDKNNPARGTLEEEFQKAQEQRTQQQAALDPNSTDVDAYQPNQGGGGPVPMKFGLKSQRGSAPILNDLSGTIYDTATKIGSMVKDVVGNLGRVIGEDANNYRIRTEVPGGVIYSDLAKADRAMRLGDEIKTKDGRLGTIRSINKDTVGVAIKRDGGFDLETQPKENITLLDNSTRNLGNTRFGNKQSGQANAFKDLATAISKGVVGIRDMYLKRDDVPSRVDLSPKESMDMVKTNLVESKTIGEFARRMELDNLDPAYLNRIPDLWNNRESVIANVGDSLYSKQDAVTRKQADNLTDANSMLKEAGLIDASGNPLKKVKSTDDLGQINRHFNVLNVMKLMNSDKLLGPVVNWAASKINKTIGDGGKIFRQLDTGLDKYRALKRSDRNGLIKVMLDYDGVENDILRDAGLQWATDDMLRSKGLGDKQIAAYKDMTRVFDMAWKIVQDIFKERGQTPPDQIPGYFPHTWVGAWRTLLHDAEGRPVKMMAAATRYGRNAQVAELIKQGWDKSTIETIDPSAIMKDNDLAASMIQALQVADGRRGLDKVMLDRLQKMESFTQRGIIREVMERNANLDGSLASEGIKPEFIWNPHNSKLMSIPVKYMQDIALFWTNHRIVSDVNQPLMSHMESNGIFSDVPNFNATMREMVQRATGHESDHFEAVDSFIRNIFIKSGLPPGSFGSVIRAFSGLIQTSKLMAGNPIYIAANMIQALTGIRNVWRVHVERDSGGAKLGNPYLSMAVGIKEWMSVRQGQGSLDTMAALKWAQDNHVIDTHQADMVNPSKIFSDQGNLWETYGIPRLMEEIEKHNRQASFLQYYSYFKQVMPKGEALRASATQMGLIMGEYAQHQSAGMYTHTGYFGTAIRPFAILRNTYLGEAYLNTQIIGDAITKAKEGNISDAQIGKALVPVAAMTVSFMALAGLSGIVGYQEWDTFARLFNKTMNPDVPLPPSGALVRMGMNKIGLKDSAWIYGLLGKFTNVNIGPSVNAPALSEGASVPALSAAASTAQLVHGALDYSTGDPPDWGSIYEAFRRIAPGWAGQASAEWIASKHNGNVPGASSDFTANTVKRTPEESLIARITGKASVSEQNQRDINSLNKYYTASDNKYKKDMTQKLSNIVDGLPSKISIDDAVKEAVSRGRGMGPEIATNILSEIARRRGMQTSDSNLEAVAKASSPAQRQRLKEIYNMLNQGAIK